MNMCRNSSFLLCDFIFLHTCRQGVHLRFKDAKTIIERVLESLKGLELNFTLNDSCLSLTSDLPTG